MDLIEEVQTELPLVMRASLGDRPKPSFLDLLQQAVDRVQARQPR
jgi:hypothetical protein